MPASEELERQHPPMSDDVEADDRTWGAMERPRLLADSLRPHISDPQWELARNQEALLQDSKKRAHRAELEAREAKLVTRELAANAAANAAKNADEHLVIRTELAAIKEQLPKAMRAGRIWTAVAGLAMLGVAVFGWLQARETAAVAKAAVQQATPTSAAQTPPHASAR
jgi:hypothetical protein